mmetsp:Transcript_21754/g.32135  ORF Transcript_21754/g.32135 Transcript_21754/m.32135 type:complete len:224 (-) Transcript_21754:37-708(-)
MKGDAKCHSSAGNMCNNETNIILRKMCNDAVKSYQRSMTFSGNKLSHVLFENDVKQATGNVRGRAEWRNNFQKLVLFRQKHKHCNIPKRYKPDPPFARWAQRQRYHYHMFVAGKPCPMTQERVEMLDDLDFIWQVKEATWLERFNELVLYKKDYGNCDVPTTYDANHTLATWVRFQRRQYRLYMQGKPSYLTETRIAKMEMIQFEWKPKKKARSVAIYLNETE